MTEIAVRSASVADSGAIASIYNHFVRNTVVTFEEEPVSAEVMAQRIAQVQTDSLPWLVAIVDGAVTGYACAHRWKARSAYRFAVETTIYIENGRGGNGIGTKLYSGLLAILRGQGIHVAIGGAALPNDASVALHQKLGFERVATFRQVGFKHGGWVDVAYWQLLL
jgi:L-amino acid N-acyltransferase YncA